MEKKYSVWIEGTIVAAFSTGSIIDPIANR